MIPKNELLGIDRDLIFQNNDSSSLAASTAVYVSSWANKQVKKAGQAASNPGDFIGLIHYYGTNNQGGLVQSSISVSDWAKIVTNGKTMHNYQLRVETEWFPGDTLYLAMGVGEDGKLTSQPAVTEEHIEVGKCLIYAAASTDALIELTYWKSSLRTTDAASDDDAVAITITTGDGGPGTAGTGGDGGAILATTGDGGTGSTTAGDSGDVTIQSGDGGVSGSGTGGASGDVLVKPGVGGASTSGTCGAAGSLTLESGAGGYHATASNGYTPTAGGALAISGGQGGLGSTTKAGGSGGAITISGGEGGTDRGFAGGDGADVTISGGDGGTGGGTDGDGGDLILDGGVGDTNGALSLGETNASSIGSGSGATLWTHDGDLVTTGGVTISGSDTYSYSSAKTIVKHVNLAQGQTAFSGAWEFSSTFKWQSLDTNEYIFFPLGIPFTGASATITIDAMVQPGATRSTQSERMRMEVAYAEPNWTTPAAPSFSAIGSTIYDDGGTSVQKITHSASWMPQSNRMYYVRIRSGSTAGTDYIYAIRITCESSILTHGLIDI